ncbi:transketolase [Allorhodopirellula heiligendammensis]|uniref:Transketolase n=1 Tax=Allorhodopirellula heiligendammensis TaxID=2714739 RepID=A0A5C6C5G7_9BACT|nr:transketolase [Allorhodopirellula heiligendammensis]TWU18716.1 Transketolase [Allorhodopirellula heiligendammensis]
MTATSTDLQTLAIDTIRTLSMDAVQTANSGHPGTPMALAPIAYQLYQNTMNYDPARPNWPGRDRFVLSCGHASMLLYSTLHLIGTKATDEHGKPTNKEAVTLEDIKKFRQIDSVCAGHPEYGYAAGIETTTGPLGAGVSNSVGMAMAEKWLAANYNTDDLTLFNYNVYSLCSDGDMMEGIANEAASVAGHLQLDNLCWIYDDNHITIEGETSLAFSEDVGKRFEGLGWNVIKVADANDVEALAKAVAEFQACAGKPTLIIVKSIIGYGAPHKQNTHGAHGAPLGWDEVALAKKAYGLPEDEKFFIPDGVMEHFAQGIGARGADASATWDTVWEKYQSAEPEKAAELQLMFDGKLPAEWDKDIPVFEPSEKGDATRNSSGKVLNAIAANVPFMIGGSADLSPSNKSDLTFDGAGEFLPGQFAGRNLHFGIREHAMAGIVNGLCLSGLRGYAATFFVFTDYMRGGMRLSSIMHLPTLYILTHDSIGVGEDGPTHQPVEHLSACRAIPGLNVYRPGDANEVAECYRAAMLDTHHPAAMVLSRQNMPTLDRTKYASATGCRRGGYILSDSEGTPDVILMSSGSELFMARDAAETLTAAGKKVRVVSMPCMDLFAQQDQSYIDEVLPPTVTNRVAIEAGIRMSWDRWIGSAGKFVGMESFGASGPYDAVYEHFHINAAAVVEAAK